MAHNPNEVSSCCGAPLVSRVLSDPTNFSDDDYDLKVRVWVCSQCHAVVSRKVVEGGQSDATT